MKKIFFVTIIFLLSLSSFAQKKIINKYILNNNILFSDSIIISDNNKTKIIREIHPYKVENVNDYILYLPEKLDAGLFLIHNNKIIDNIKIDSIIFYVDDIQCVSFSILKDFKVIDKKNNFVLVIFKYLEEADFNVYVYKFDLDGFSLLFKSEYLYASSWEKWNYFEEKDGFIEINYLQDPESLVTNKAKLLYSNGNYYMIK